MKKILIVEDDADFQDIYKQRLTDEGYQVQHAYVGKQALEMLKGSKPDLILLDIMLPGGMNGFDILEQVKANNDLKAIPVIVLTNLDGEAKTAKEIGAVDYIVKANTSLDEVVAKIKKKIP